MTEKNARKKILIAEDNESLRKITKQLLGRGFPEFDVETFADGSSLELRLNNGIDSVAVVMTDNTMPGVHGSDIIRRYALEQEFRKIPFILC